MSRRTAKSASSITEAEEGCGPPGSTVDVTRTDEPCFSHLRSLRPLERNAPGARLRDVLLHRPPGGTSLMADYQFIAPPRTTLRAARSRSWMDDSMPNSDLDCRTSITRLRRSMRIELRLVRDVASTLTGSEMRT